MKRALIACSLALAAASASAVDVTINAVSCTAGVTGCAYALDGAFPAFQQYWQTETAWWNGTAQSVTYTLPGSRLLTGLVVSLDNNDDYLLETSVNGSTWTPLITVLSSMGSAGTGMDTFATTPGQPYYLPALAFAPVTAGFVRISAIGGDSSYSVGELTLTAAVPEPGTWALLAAGVGIVALRRRAAVR